VGKEWGWGGLGKPILIEVNKRLRTTNRSKSPPTQASKTYVHPVEKKDTHKTPLS